MGHRADQVEGADRVVVTDAVHEDNPEVAPRPRAGPAGAAALGVAGGAGGGLSGDRHRRDAWQDDASPR